MSQIVSLKGIVNSLRSAVSFSVSTKSTIEETESAKNTRLLETSYDKTYQYLRDSGLSDLNANKVAKKYRRLYFEGRESEIPEEVRPDYLGITGSP